MLEKRSTSLVDKLKKDLAKYKHYYNHSNSELKQLRKEYDKKISVLSKQLEELREFEGDIELNSLTNAVINSVTVNELNEIRELMREGSLKEVLKSDKHISALQKLFIGLSYGIIPVTAPQRIALTDAERNMVKKLENASIRKVRSYIRANKNSFIKLFEVINDSVKLMCNSYARYA